MKKEIATERIKVLQLKQESLKVLARIKRDNGTKELIEYKNEIAREIIRIAGEIKRLGGLR